MDGAAVCEARLNGRFNGTLLGGRVWQQVSGIKLRIREIY